MNRVIFVLGRKFHRNIEFTLEANHLENENEIAVFFLNSFEMRNGFSLNVRIGYYYITCDFHSHFHSLCWIRFFCSTTFFPFD